MSVADFLAATPPDDLMAGICFSDSVMLLAQVEVRPGNVLGHEKDTREELLSSLLETFGADLAWKVGELTDILGLRICLDWWGWISRPELRI